MARFVLDPSRVNFSTFQRGKEYNLRVLQRAQVVFTNLLNLLPSNYVSAIQGPNYTLELKAVAVELARIELALEEADLDRDFTKTRSEFLYSIVGYLVFLNGRLPQLEQDDEEFRTFLLNLIRIYFQGAVPSAMAEAAGLFFDQGLLNVFENFVLTRSGVSGLDISDQFGFQISLEPNTSFPEGLFDLQSSLRTVLDVIRPSHTLFQIRYVFHDDITPGDSTSALLDAMRWRMSTYHYDDFRSYWTGTKDIDRLGMKENQRVVAEDHSSDF